MRKVASNQEVCVVITTYHPNATFICSILDRLLGFGVGKILIIHNGGVLPDLSDYAEVQVFRCYRNLGSAGGYQLGMKLMLDGECEFIWLLDQDNLPAEDALVELWNGWSESVLQVSPEQLMLLSYRPLLFRYLHPFKSKGVLNIGPKRNSYLGFHYAQVLQILKNRVKGASNSKRYLEDFKSYVELNSGYYGGLFFHRSLLKDNNLPNSNLFLYWDDIDFTDRFYQKGGSIRLVIKSRVEDLDAHEVEGAKNGWFSHPFIDLRPDFRAFYYIRNLAFYEKQWSVRSSPHYLLNKALMLSIVCLIALCRGEMKRVSLLLKAAKCGQRMNHLK